MSAYLKVYLGLLILTLIIYLIPARKKARYEKMVILLLVLWMATVLTARYIVNVMGVQNNLLVFHISTPLEYAILSLLYRDLIVSPVWKKIISWSIPSFIALAILFSVFIQGTDINNSRIFIVQSVLMVFWSLLYLREVLLLQQITVLHRSPAFWISVGILFYHIGHLIIEGMLNYLMSHSMDLALRIYRIEYIFKYLLFILFIIGAFYSKAVPVLQKERNR